jgi:hypothetical protein
MCARVSATLHGLWLCLSPSAVCQSNVSDHNKPPLPEYIQEFFLSDAVRNQERGEFQLTVGVETRHTIGTNATPKMEYGVTERFQVGLDLPYRVSEEEYWEDSSKLKRMNLGVRYQIIKSDTLFALSVGIDSGVGKRWSFSRQSLRRNLFVIYKFMQAPLQLGSWRSRIRMNPSKTTRSDQLVPLVRSSDHRQSRPIQPKN